MLPRKIEWLRTKVFPEVMKAQSFGVDVKKFVSFELNDKKATDQYTSDVAFGEVTIEKKDGQLVTESVVIKFQPTIETTRDAIDCDAHFHNEILFYSKLIPLFRKYDTDNVLSKNFCEFVFGKATNGRNPEEDVIILKNLNKKGFKLTDERLFIDESHIKLALDRIAKYHALSFKCQLDDPKGFFSIVAQIKDPSKKLDKNRLPKKLVTLCTSRGIHHLQNDPKYKDQLSDIQKHCEEVDSVFGEYRGPSGPLNVIAHGDFSRNNMIFKYGNNGEPVDVVFFDLAIIRYCSPAIDTSFFLLLNSSPEVKRLHWDDFLEIYYESLSRQLDGHPYKPSFEDIELDLRKKGIYGYRMCSIVLPVLMELETKEDWGGSADVNKQMKKFEERGGLKATEYLAEIVKHMLDKDYIFEH